MNKSNVFIFYFLFLSKISLDQGWPTLIVTRASIFSPLYPGARLLIHVHTPLHRLTQFPFY